MTPSNRGKPRASRVEVRKFLAGLKSALASGTVTSYPRSKNQESLAQLGLDQSATPEILGMLQVADYSGGPEPHDRGFPGDVWIFGTDLDSMELYIKILIMTGKRGQKCYSCISIHKADYQISHPYPDG